MRRLALPVLLALALLVPAACGRNEVDEAALPTPVPTYTTEASGAAAAAAPTEAVAPTEAATDTETASAAETPADAEAVAESDAASQDQAAGAAAEGTPEPAATEAAAATATPEPTATPAPTEAAEPTATVAPTATPEPTTAPAPTATPEPTAAPETAADSGAADSSGADSGADSEFAGVPEGVAALIPSADVARGEQLTLQNACIGCHNLNPDLPMAGPTWHNVAETAATRVEGESAPAYFYNSIVHPNDYVVDGYAPGVMIQTYGDTLSDQDLADIIGYLLTLKGQ